MEVSREGKRVGESWRERGREGRRELEGGRKGRGEERKKERLEWEEKMKERGESSSWYPLIITSHLPPRRTIPLPRLLRCPEATEHHQSFQRDIR